MAMRRSQRVNRRVTATDPLLRRRDPKDVVGFHFNGSGPLSQSRWYAMLITLPSGARTKNRRTPHGSVVIGYTIS